MRILQNGSRSFFQNALTASPENNEGNNEKNQDS
jgi:hypothetical protein